MIYRVSISFAETGHKGYEYFTSLREAQQAVAQWKKNWGDMYNLKLSEITIDQRPTPTCKADVIEMLNAWGSHPNHG